MQVLPPDALGLPDRARRGAQSPRGVRYNRGPASERQALPPDALERLDQERQGGLGCRARPVCRVRQAFLGSPGESRAESGQEHSAPAQAGLAEQQVWAKAELALPAWVQAGQAVRAGQV